MRPLKDALIGLKLSSLLLMSLTLSPLACSDPVPTKTPGQDASRDLDERPDMGRVDMQDLGGLCKPNSLSCKDLTTQLICDAAGQSQQEQPCGPNLRCQAETGQCLDQICTPGRFDGCTESGQQRYCNTSGTGFVEDFCPGQALCQDGKCANPECVAGIVRCIDPKSLEICNEAGAYVPGAPCPLGTECFNGVCEPLCELNKKVSSNIGCEYWSVDLDNYDDALSQPHAIVVTNPNPTIEAKIDIFVGYTDQKLLMGADGLPFELKIPPGQQRAYSIPTGFDHSGTRQLQNKALRITSSIPIIAHQFNPLNNVDVYSNDGTLLIPTNTIDSEYWGLSWPHRGGNINIRGFLTVVNTTGAPNRVLVRPSAQVVAGPGIPTINAGEERFFELGPGDSLNLETSGIEFEEASISGCLKPTEGPPTNLSPCPDLTGTYIKADQPVMVFGGHQCGNVVMGINRCDHMESILFPVSSWGKDYVGTKFKPRAPVSTPEPDVWRVIAAQDGTQLLTDPPIDGVHGRTINAGQWRQFEAREGFRLGASKPVMLAQYMVGSNWLGIPRICNMGIDAANPTGIGDPAMALAVPISQYRKDYAILTPNNYEEDYLNVVAPTNAQVILDGAPIPQEEFKPIGARPGFSAATLRVNAGEHRLSSEVAFGVITYGYACHVSYATAGGLNLEKSDP